MNKRKFIKISCLSLIAIVPLAVGLPIGLYESAHNPNKASSQNLPFKITTDYNIEYNSSGGNVKLIAIDSTSGGDVSSLGIWSVDPKESFYSITSGNYLYWSKPLEANNEISPYKVDVTFNITYSNGQQYNATTKISINITPNIHKSPIIQTNYLSYYNPLFGGNVELISNMQGGDWSIEPQEHFKIVENNLTWDENVEAGSQTLTVHYKHENYAVVSEKITLNLIKPDLNGDNWIGKVSGTLRSEINGDVVLYYYSSDFVGIDLAIPGIVFDKDNLYKIEIDTFVFTQTHLLGKLTICGGVLNIGNYAFSNCKQLTSLYLSRGLQNINSHAFDGCNSISGPLILPDTLTDMGENAFANCSSITSISIPTSFNTIKEDTFWGDISITNIDLGQRNQKITFGPNAFHDLPSVGNITSVGSWNCKEEILNEFINGGLSQTWSVNEH